MEEKVFKFNDPIKNYELEFKLIPAHKLRTPTYQRDVNPAYREFLVDTIKENGFLVPLLVKQEGDNYQILDGLHRFFALLRLAKELNIEQLKIPCLVLPSDIVFNFYFNIRYVENFNKRAVHVYKYYKYLVDNNPEMKETEIKKFISHPYYIPAGILLMEIDNNIDLQPFEGLLHKVDIRFLDKPLKESYQIRKKEAQSLYDAYQFIKDLIKDTAIPHNYIVMNWIMKDIADMLLDMKIEKVEHILDVLKSNLELLKLKIQQIEKVIKGQM